jgi:hypothetical protein
MTTGVLAIPPVLQFTLNNGQLAAGGSILTQVGGVNAATYQDSGLTTPLPNPIPLNSRGEISNASGASCQLFLTPNTVYTFTLFDANGNQIWVATYVNGIQLTAAQIEALSVTGAVLYSLQQTAAEIAASVVPSSYSYPELTFERYGGGIGMSATTNNAAMTSALAVSAEKAGGKIIFGSAGTYSFTASFSLTNQLIMEGAGSATILNYTGTGAFLTILSAAGRVQIRDMQLTGTGQQGFGIVLGNVTANGTLVTLRNLMVNYFGTGLRIGGATWLTCQKCEFGSPVSGSLGTITNNIGVDFNYFGTNDYSSAITFIDCIVANNGTNGVASTNVPVTMNNVVWINCNVQANCQNATSNPQFYMSPVLGFTIDTLYMEYLLGGTAPDAFRIDGMGSGQIRGLYVNTAANGIIDRGGGSVGQVEILSPHIFGITTGDAVNMASEADVQIRNGTITGTVVLTGLGCNYLPLGSGLASWPHNENGFTPAMAFGGGSITQTVAAAVYSQVGNVVTFSFRINWSAIAAPTGNITITGLPKAPVSGGPDVTFAAWCSGVTIASGYVALEVPNGATTGTLYNVQTTTTAVQGGALAASGTLIISGSYQV